MTTAPAEVVTISGFGPPPLVVVDVDLDDEALAVELEQPDGMEAARWAALDDFLNLFPGALPDDQRAYWTERLADPDDPFTGRAARTVAYQIARAVYAVPWWTAHRLCSRAAAHWWAYEAWTVTKGFDPRTAPAARIVASCWAWAAAGADKDEDLEALRREVFEGPTDLGHEDRLARGNAMLSRLQSGRSG
ncbi:hypothetical protein [Streptomyces sp. NPDC088739]|uniref:hypothetical protein n=1 Tax=Streptomyces sp. NPDC088739 TaxID=3365882 RepID=UPI00382C0B1C